jgi:hypothetical protein
MSSTLARFHVFAGVAIAVACFAPHATAGCLDVRTAPIASLHSASPRVRTVAFGDDDNDRAPIVGLWKIQFILPGAGPMGEDVVIDDGYATWHSDGTELMNSSRPPVTGSFCMGVWKQTGRRTFSLNHWALSWSDDGSTFVGPTNITEVVTVYGDGDSYKGTFQITQYDKTGKTPLGGPSGIVVGTRIKP